MEPIKYVLASNCNGTGISTLTDELLWDISRNQKLVERLVVFKPKRTSITIIRYLAILFDFFTVFICSNIRPGKVVVLANYFPLPSLSKTIIVVRHPFLLKDSDLMANILIESTRRLVFYISCIFADKIFLQTDAMHSLFCSNRKYKRFLSKTEVLPNPLRDLRHFEQSAKTKRIDELKSKGLKLVVYPSGYYPHKNFELVSKIAIEHEAFMVANKLMFIFCVSPNQSFYSDVLKINSFRTLQERHPNLFHCCGRLNPGELNYIYSVSTFGIFPSSHETYGNGLYEMANLNLPFLFNKKLDFVSDDLYSKRVDFENGDEVINILRDFCSGSSEITKIERMQGNKVYNQVQWFEKVVKD